jgi:hypothetical protein
MNCYRSYGQQNAPELFELLIDQGARVLGSS